MTEALLEWPAEGYRRAPYAVFHDARIFEREQERIYRGPAWHYIGLEAELREPGAFKRSFVGVTPIVVTRDLEGAFHAFVNRCAHRGSLVCLEHSGKTRDGFTCVYHAWSYDHAGNLTSAAFRHGIRGQGGLPADFEFRDHALETLRVESFHGILFGTFSKEAPPLADYIGEVAGFSLRRAMKRPIRVLGYDSQIINANWKTYGENSRDTFHANILHTFFGTFGISRQTQDSAIVVDPRGLHYYTYTRRGTEVASEEYDSTAANLRSVKSDFGLLDPSLLEWEDEFGDGASTHLTSLFPVFMLQQVSHSLAVRQLIPKSPERCELLFTYFGYEDDPPELAERRLRHHNLTGSAGLVSMEDGTVCELVGQGTAGAGGAASFMEMGGKDLTGGGGSKLSEKPLRNFWNAYRTYMDF